MLYNDAMAELFGLAEAGELPEPVIWALLSLFADPVKLFCCEPDVRTADGVWTASPVCQFQASDLLVKLVLAVRALDWEVVIGEQHAKT